MNRSKLENRNGVDYLTFRPIGTPLEISLPVITSGNRDKAHAWTWNGSLKKPTLRPSIRTKYNNEVGTPVEIHYWLTDGICHCLSDCTDGHSNKNLELEIL